MDKALPSDLRKSASLVEALSRRAASSPDGWAYSFLGFPDEGGREEGRLTWGELDHRARAIAGLLQGFGARGERILLLYPPGLDFIAAFFGCLYAGAVAVPSYPPGSGRSQPRLRSILADAGPRVALTTRAIAAKWMDLAPDLPGAAGMAILATEEVADDAAGSWTPPLLTSEDLAFLQYTSGSTSAPKGVMVTHGNLVHNARLIRDACGHDEGSTFVSWLPMYHDMGLIGCVLQPLFVGAACVLMSPLAFLQKPERWLRAIDRYRAHTSGAPNFAYDLCVRKIPPERREGLDLSVWQVAFNGAEPVHAATLDAFAEAFSPCGFRQEAFFPCYGLAEATLIVSGRARPEAPVVQRFRGLDQGRPVSDPEAAALVASGEILSGQRVAIVDPGTGEPVDGGRVGEIWISGPSVALGYWGQPEQTERDFHARLGGEGDCYLRTGDLGFLQDGRLFVTGRLKDLIIVRGRNHYPQDVERTAESSHPVLRSGAGAAFAVDLPGGEGMALVQEADPRRGAEQGPEAIESIRRAVAEEHGVALAGVTLVRPGTVPKTTSGKIQRQLCRQRYLEGAFAPLAEWRWSPDGVEEEPVAGLADAAPGTVVSWLCRRVAQCLGVEPSAVDPERSLAALGLDSIEAIELAHAAAVELGVELHLNTLLDAPSLAGLAVQMEALLPAYASEQTVAVVSPRSSGDLPLAPGPRGLWILQSLDPESPAYNIAGAARIVGDVDDDALRRAFHALVARHPALRSTFPAPGGEPVQRIAAEGEPEHEHAATELVGEDILRLLAAETIRPFDLERGPLVRVHRVDAPGGERLLTLTLHHIVADLWSVAVLLDELGSLYAVERGGTAAALAPLPEPSPELPEAGAEEAAGRWRARLEGYPALLDLPTDRSRPARPRHCAAGCRLELGAETTDHLRELARHRGSTLFVALQAVFQAWLHRVTGRDRLLVGSPAAGRDRVELARQVGYFVQTAVLPADAGGDPEFGWYLERTRGAVLEALRDALPLPSLVDAVQPERDPARHPLFQVMCSLQKAPLARPELAAFALGEPGARLDIGGLILEAVPLPEIPAPFDLVLLAADSDGRLAASLQVDLDLFDRVTGDRLARQLSVLLEAVAAAPARRLSELPLLGDGERWQLLAEWNDTARARQDGRLVPQRVRDAARRAPDALAVVQGGRSLTYETLVRRAGSLAALLRRLGVKPEDRVTVFSERSPDMIVGLLAVLEAGSAYVPIDPASPVDRVGWLLRDCGARVILAQRSLAQLLPATELPVLLLEEDERDAALLPVELEPARLAYAVYTSGSTGLPKAVQVSHGSLANLVDWHLETFRCTAADVMSHVAGVAFDASVWEIWPCLAAGARLELPPEEVRTSPAALRGWLGERGVTVAFVPTPLAHELLALDVEDTGLRLLLTGGDELRIRPRPGLDFRLWNNYGPTEGTVVATSGPVEPEGAVPPDIGRPVHNARVHLLDRSLQPVPPGASGELCLAGAGLARGYLGRPELTAERFVPDPLSAEAGGRLYCTGDQARWRPDGTLAFLGRLDRQMKVRGIRVEPAEIEAVLLRHPAVTDAVVLASAAPGEERRLVACVATHGVQSGELRGFLASCLPAAMVPSRYLLLDSLPLTPNGKVDRRALLALAAAEEEPAPLSGTPLEQIVAGILAEALGRDRIGLHDDFFELGGHSLLAARSAARVREALGVELPLRRLFESPTAAGLAVAVAEALGSGRPPEEPPRPRPGGDDAPLTSGQERLWFLDRLQTGAAYNVPVEARLTGTLSVAALAAALAGLERRHEALRTTFPEVKGTPVQRVAAPAGQGLLVVDLENLAEPLRETEAARLAQEEARRPFDLAAGPVVRRCLLRLDGSAHRLLLVLHHIICDGRSLEVLLTELAALYSAALKEGSPPLPAPPLQLADVAAWERERLSGPALDEALAYWERKLAQAPPLELPADRPRPPARSLRGGTSTQEIAAPLAVSASTLARRERATPFLLLLAAFAAQLHRYTGQRDLTLGSPMAGRSHPGMDGVVGFLVNTIGLRIEVSRDLAFRDLLARVRRCVLEAFGHADLPFEKVVERLRPERALSHNPLFQVTFALETGRAPVAFPGLELDLRGLETGTAKLDLGMTLAWSESGPSASLEHAADLFDAATADRMLGHFATLLAGAVEEPGRAVGDLPLLDAAERLQVLAEWNRTTEPASWRAVHEEVAAWAALRPDAPAVAEEGVCLTFRELDLRAARIGRVLRNLGVGQETVVAVLARRAPDLISAALGVLNAGGAYAPLDPMSPAGRLESMLREVGAGAVLAESELAHLLPGVERVVLLDSREVEEAAPLPLADRATVDPDQLAYLVFTSGSTGVPKAVATRHGPLANLAAWTRRTHGLEPGDRGAQLAGPAFDASVWETWAFLTAGASLSRPDEGTRLAPSRLVAWMAAERLTAVFLPTPVAELVLAEPWPETSPLRVLLTGGDRLRRRPEPRHSFLLANHYGPSEATVVTTWGVVSPGGPSGRPPTIGGPIANAQVVILDPGFAPVPLGVPGELCVGGDSLARGYFGRPDLTAERFVPDPFRGVPGARLYRSGDLARWLRGGEIEFLGRLDHQVKLRGLRIEIGEIEAALGSHPGVREAVVALRTDPRGEPRLVAWVAGPPGTGAFDPAALRPFLLARLPAYMIPSVLLSVPELPLTANGKVDRSALPEPDWGRPELSGEYVAPRTAVESRLAGIWAELLEVERVGIHDSFFELGGHSLKAARLVARLREAFGVELPVQTVFEAPTVAHLSVAIAVRLLQRVDPATLSRVRAGAEQKSTS